MAQEQAYAFDFFLGAESLGDHRLLNGVRGVAVDRGSGDFYAVSSSSRVSRFTRDGLLLAQWGADGSGPGELKVPQDIAVGPQGHVYIADTGNCRIQRFTPDGEFLGSWGRKGTGEGEMGQPQPPAAWRRMVLGLDVCVRLSERDLRPMDQVLSIVKGDVIAATMADGSWGGLAMHTTVGRQTYYADSRGFEGVVIELEIDYATAPDDTYENRI